MSAANGGTSDPLFRVSRVDVSEVAAVVSTATLGVIRTFLGDIPWRVLSESESEITLPVLGALTLFRECGKLNGYDPRHEHTYLIYDSLSHIVYGLIEDD